MKITTSALIFIALLPVGCQDVPFLADKDATLLLAANKTFLRTGGDTADITITGFSGTWGALRDGTLVTLTATLGSIPPTVELRGGQARATFLSGSARGQAKITARSGNAVTELALDIEYSAQAKITLKATPASLPAAGGRVEIDAEVTDGKGNPFLGTAVTLRATSGHFDNGQDPVYTDSQGIAIAHLQTDATAEVTASALGQGATLTVNVAQNSLPTASFTYWPSSPKVGEDVIFDGVSSSDSDGKIVQYSWSFNDGYEASGRKVTRSFSRSGSYEVFLQVKDNLGALSTTTSKTVEVVDNQAPEATFQFFPSNPTVNADVRFDGSMSTDPDGEIVTWEWEFGDGARATGEEPTHAYHSAGSFQARLKVTDNDGLQDDNTQTVTVGNNQAPAADFTYVKSTSGAPLTYDLNSSTSYDADGYILTYAWDFGDGTGPVTGSSTGVTHTFSETKTYRVTLAVTDNLGSKGEVMKDVVVE